jgi:hypothetical protein
MKIKLLMMTVALFAFAVFTAFSPVRPINEAEAQNKSSEQNDNRAKRSKQAEKATQKAEKGTSAEDKNITAPRSKNSANSKSVKSRGTGQKTCYIDLINETDYVIDIYIDGNYKGTLGGNDAKYTTTGTGSTRLYARADFDDGSYLYWGPKNISCGNNARDGYYEWTLAE